MKKTVWEEREKAFEDKYFRDLEREQLRKLREKSGQKEQDPDAGSGSGSLTDENSSGHRE